MDGAYYALKGYAYQFDKTILAILGETDPSRPVGFERIQDIDNGDYVLQIKFKETQDFSLVQL